MLQVSHSVRVKARLRDTFPTATSMCSSLKVVTRLAKDMLAVMKRNLAKSTLRLALSGLRSEDIHNGESTSPSTAIVISCHFSFSPSRSISMRL